MPTDHAKFFERLDAGLAAARVRDAEITAQRHAVRRGVAPTRDAESQPNDPVEARARAEFARDPKLRDEFGSDIDACVAFFLAEAQGRIRYVRK